MKTENLRLVLVGTTHAGNIGQAARAMKTMGLADLHLVAPVAGIDEQALANAGNATDVLASARLHGTLDEALAGARLVFGLTARGRRHAVPAAAAREAAAEAAAASDAHPVALLFGREHSGLTNDEIDRCHRVVHIPANPDYPVLNVAAAVQVVCYELRMAGEAGEDGAAGKREPPAGAEHLEGFYEHLQRVAHASGYVEPNGERLLMRRLRRLFNRARPEHAELNILRGLLAAVERRMR